MYSNLNLNSINVGCGRKDTGSIAATLVKNYCP